MTPNLIAAVDAAMVEMQNIHPPLKRSECERLIRAALSAPAEPVSRETVQVVGVRISTDGFGSYIADSAMGIGGPAPGEVRESLMTVNQHNRMMAAPPSPDAELVELLRDARADLAAYIDGAYPQYMLEYPHNQRKHAADTEIVRRIDAKLAILK